jgi:hypothetical protein
MIRVFAQIVAALLSLSALGYFIGWREASTYYIELGAPWAASMLPSSVLLQLSPEIAALIGGAAFLGFYALATGQTSAQGLNRFTRIILMIALGLYFANWWLIPWVNDKEWLTAMQVYLATRLVAWGFAISAGLTVAELLGHLKLAGWQMKPTHMMLIFVVVLFGLYQSPAQLGKARARYHLDPDATELPLVKVPDSPPDLKWRLVHVVDGRALLLLSPTKESKNCTFRVIDAKDLCSIGSAAR